MTEQLPGLELFLSSDKAVAGANKFREAVESAAQAVERIGAVVERLDATLDRLGKAASSAGTPLKKTGEAAAKADSQFREGAAGAAVFDARLGRLGTTSLGVGRSLSLLLGTAGAISGIAAGVAAFSDYEDKLRILGSVSNATVGDLRRLEEAAIDLSKSTRFSPREALQGLTELSRAGLGAREAMAAIKPTADLARVGLVGLGDASGIVTKTITQFGLAATDSARVADVLAKAANASNADVSQLADSLAKTGPVARQYGVSLEDTVSALAKIADNGLAANIAGTGLQRVLIQLRSPTEEAQRALLGLGLTTEKVNPEKAGLIGALNNLANANITVQDSVALVGTEFASLLTILTSSVGAIQKTGDALRDSTGEAAKQAAAGADTLAASFADLRSASEQFAVSASRGGIGGALSAITRTGAEVFRILADDKKAMDEAGVAAKLLAGGLQLASVAGASFAALKLAGFVQGTVVAMRAATATTVAFEAATGTAAASVGRASKAFAALSAVVRANPFGAAAAAIGAVVSALYLFGGGSEAAAEKARKQKQEVEDLDKQYRDLLGTLGKVNAGQTQFADRGLLDTQFRAAREEIQKIGTELEELKGKRVPLEKVLGVAAISDAGDRIAKIQELIAKVPDVQRAADVVAAQERARLNATLPNNAMFRSLGEDFARSAEIERRAADARQAVLQALNESFRVLGVTVDESGRRFFTYDDAIATVRKSLAALDEKATASGVSLARVGDGSNLVTYSSAVAALVAEREKELRIAALTGAEREKAILIAEAEKRSGAALTDIEKDRLAALAKQIVESQKLLDTRRREAQEAERVAKQQEDLPRTLAALRQKYEEQLLLAKAEGTEREVVRAEIEAANDAKEIGLALDTEAFQKLKDLAVAAARLNAEQRREKRQERSDDRREDAFRKLEQEEDLLKQVGIEREAYKVQIEAENEARQAGLKVGSDEFQSYVKRKKAVAELTEAQRKLSDAGRQAGEAIGSGLERLIFDGERARDVIRSLAEDLGRLLFRQNVTNNLAGLLSNLGQLIAGGGGSSSGPPAGTTITYNPFTGASSSTAPKLLGGVIPAMSGEVVDSFGVMQRGRKAFSFAEGGATTPEAIFPLARDDRGRLGVLGAGGGGGDRITMVFPGVRNQQDARAMRATIGQQIRQLREQDRRGRRGLRPQEGS